MSRSKYMYVIRKYNDQPFILIWDKGTETELSVTNNISDVVEEICKRESINPVEFNIIYSDGEQKWDGYIFATEQFVISRADDWRPAADYLLENK